MPKKILFINQEITPYVPESSMATLGQKLSEKTQERGYEIRTFMPKWGTINERRGQLHEVIRLSGVNITIDDTDHPLLIKVASIPVSRVQVYFIDNEDYFSKKRIDTDESGDDSSDNGERAVFYARGVLETVKKLRWNPDVIVCQGWMAAAVPLYLKSVYNEEPCFANAKVITSIFNEQLDKEFAKNFKRSLAFREITEDSLKQYKDDFDFFELGKMAIDFSDGLILATPDANTELRDYAHEKNIPVLEYPGEDFSEAYGNFFEEITQ